MATKQLSPTGNLLRNSRLFSLPPPLPRPSGTLTASQRFDSETATLPYPTQAALETTPSSLARGDWGLKRSLPLKSTTRTSTPVIRIGDVDSINHITDFDSAADHALNLRKWQEMGLPVSKAEPRVTASKNLYSSQQRTESHKSVFDSTDDNTEPENDAAASGRWKYRGPWLAGQTQGEFKKYAEKEIRNRKGEFREFLRERLVQKATSARRRAAIDNGETLPTQPAMTSDVDLDLYIKILRKDDATLFPLIEEFLDLPNTRRTTEGWNSEDSVQGPPATHPSAGLSYLRAIAHTSNHPVLGPQREERPIQGRILVAQIPRRRRALLGVGGIVSEDPRDPLFKDTEPRGMRTFDPDVPGGAKVQLHPERISIDTQGKIKLRTKRADNKTVVLYMRSEQASEEQTPDVKAQGTRQMPQLDRPPKPAPKGYGLGSGHLGGSSTQELMGILGPE